MGFNAFQEFIDIIRQKNILKINRFQKLNSLVVTDKKILKNIELNLKGENNVIKIASGANIEKLKISGYAKNSTIDIGENFSCKKLNICIGQNHPNFGQVDSVKLLIGSNTSIESCSVYTYNSHSEISIGDNCMIAKDVDIYNTDAHPIYDKGTGKLLNKVSKLVIGNHVWIGKNVTLLKNVHIADDCIIGYNATVTKSVDKSFCAIAGNPAKIVKENIVWNANGSQEYRENKQDEGMS